MPKVPRVEKISLPESAASSRHALITRPLPVFLLLSLLAALIYSNTLSVPFVFDDNHNIVENTRIKNLSNFLDFSGTRYVGFLSFALNYHFGGLSVFGYHLVNLLIHIINGFLVYNLVLLLFKSAHRSQSPEQTNGSVRIASWIALATALLFIVHPIQTQAVTYIVQRFASLAALFYLLTVVCYLKWRLASSDKKHRYLWYGGALLSTVLAVKTKEISFTLPLMIILIEAVFFRPFTHRRWASLIPFLLTLLIIPFSHMDVRGETESGLALQTTGISRFDYLFTQFRVIVTYIRLLFLPINQNLDYDYLIYHSPLDPSVLLSFLFLLSLCVLALYLLFDSKFKSHNFQLVSLGLLWFFLTLSIESSIIPIQDVIYEHRLYLPSVGLLLAITVAIGSGFMGARLSHGWILVGIASFLVVVVLSIASYQRNAAWRDETALWTDVILKSPNKARGHNNLGATYADRGKLDEAVDEYRKAITLKPDYADAYNNLGSVLLKLGQTEAANEEIQKALLLRPKHHAAYNELGLVYYQQGKATEAIEAFSKAIRLKPDYVAAHNNLGMIYYKQGRFEEAGQSYQTALRLNPDALHPRLGLALVYAKQGQLENALQEYKTALKLDLNQVVAHFNIGVIYEKSGRVAEAREHYDQVLHIDPNFQPARKALEFLSR